MVRAINHDTGSSIATGTWESVKGAAIGAAAIPVTTAIVGGVIGVLALSGVGIVAALAAGAVGAMIGGVGGVAIAATVGAPLVGALAAIGGLLGLGHGANKISNEKAAYEAKVMNNARTNDAQRIQDFQTGRQQGAAEAV